MSNNVLFCFLIYNLVFFFLVSGSFTITWGGFSSYLSLMEFVKFPDYMAWNCSSVWKILGRYFFIHWFCPILSLLTIWDFNYVNVGLFSLSRIWLLCLLMYFLFLFSVLQFGFFLFSHLVHRFSFRPHLTCCEVYLRLLNVCYWTFKLHNFTLILKTSTCMLKLFILLFNLLNILISYFVICGWELPYLDLFPRSYGLCSYCLTSLLTTSQFLYFCKHHF